MSSSSVQSFAEKRRWREGELRREEESWNPPAYGGLTDWGKMLPLSSASKTRAAGRAGKTREHVVIRYSMMYENFSGDCDMIVGPTSTSMPMSSDSSSKIWPWPKRPGHCSMFSNLNAKEKSAPLNSRTIHICFRTDACECARAALPFHQPSTERSIEDERLIKGLSMTGESRDAMLPSMRVIAIELPVGDNELVEDA
ncbi:unnamed protein product [Dovyalis caffra]|uniref:Uncharacterized protein n=1 Tax=Dovyalis caffra TaxID=77055 RepID=A0AAV1S9P5_9ROSI|nr:unnamed protein product [Dovyalis caffra]